jgi:hypothetical protein
MIFDRHDSHSGVDVATILVRADRFLVTLGIPYAFDGRGSTVGWHSKVDDDEGSVPIVD